MKEKEEEVCSLKERLCLQQIETEKVKTQWRAECDKVKEMELSFDKGIVEFTAAWESRLTVREEKAAAELKALQEGCEKM